MSSPTDKPPEPSPESPDGPDYLPEQTPKTESDSTPDPAPDPASDTGGLSNELADMRDEFAIWVEDQSGWDHKVAAARITHVVGFLTWATQDPDVGDPFANEEARDRAVGFYKRFLFQQGCKPDVIDAVLCALACLYGWAGLGAHNVGYLLADSSEPAAEPAAQPDPQPDTETNG